MRFDIDETARPYDPQNPPPGVFWEHLADATNAAGLLAFLLLTYGLIFGLPLLALAGYFA